MSSFEAVTVPPLPASSSLAAETPRSLTPFQRLVSAACGATLVALLVTPFDVIKTRMQSDISHKSKPGSLIFDETTQKRRTALECISQNMRRSGNKGISLSDLEASSALRPFRSTMDGFIRIAHYEGLPALWRGLTPALAMQAPSTVFYYLGYEEIRDRLMPLFSDSNQHFYPPILAGSLARTGTTILISPLELIKTRMQSASGSSSSLRNVLSQLGGMMSTSGVLSLWRGLGTTLWRDVPFSATYWVGYEGLKRVLQNNKSVVDMGDFGTSFVAGATAGTFSAIITTPFDVAKTLQQVVHHNEPGCGTAQPHRQLGMVNVMRTVVVNDGFKGLFVGLGPRIAKIAPACAVMISSYELGKRFFEGRNNKVK
ncbi:hypothetical protein HDU98_006761 [Podochytrium sp. JEL0797]|nr:hypothetical protein HDU98_006761 [Podochytrium sp. JEL0797]